MKEKKSAQWKALIIIMMGVIVCAIVYSFVDPSTSFWVPKCPLHFLTGWNCPACGLQRAIYAFLHGHFSQGLAYNYFLIFSLPYAAALVFALALKNMNRGEHLIHAIQHPMLLKTYVVLFFTWGVLRNILGI